MSALVERKLIVWLFNPFVFIAGARALGFGLVGILVAGLIAGTGGAHFDGILDLHLGRAGFSYLPMAEGLIDWLCLAFVLFVCGKFVSKTAFRFVDVFGTQALARWPAILTSLLVLPSPFRRFTNEALKMIISDPAHLRFDTSDAIYFFAATLLMLPLIVWMIALMYTAYAVSCNVRGLRAGLSFTIGLILAEILSKLAIYALC